MAQEEEIHPHWNQLVDRMSQLGINEIEQRKVELQRLLYDSGVTYNAYNQVEPENIWKLDPIPYLIASDTWDDLDSGIRQRAVLLDLLLKDIYGDQKVIKDGLLPVELIHADRQFLRPCYPYIKTAHPQLLLYAADISRDANGQLWVVGDRTQAPSGWSYLMVNRIVMARILPELFVQSNVRKILPFFQQIRKNLASFSPSKKKMTL